MVEIIQDKIIAFEDCKEYNISYPVIIKRWEIRQVNGLNKQYLQIYFQKIEDSVKAFKFNVKCYSDFGEVEEIYDITLQELDNLNIEFSKVVSLKSEVTKVEILITQALMLDNTIIEPQENQIVIDTFKSFNDEDEEAAKRLLPTAKGYPIDNVSHWFCACGLPYKSETQRCVNCNKSKEELFNLITQDKIQEEKILIKNNNNKNRNIKIVLSSIVLGAVLLTLISLCFYILYQIRAVDLWYSWFYKFWDTTLGVIAFNLLFIVSIILSICLLVIHIIGGHILLQDKQTMKNERRFNKINDLIYSDKKFKKLEFFSIIICFLINVVNCVWGMWFKCFSTCYIPILLNFPFTIAYFICNKQKVLDKICNSIDVKKDKE